jgi:protein TonB
VVTAATTSLQIPGRLVPPRETASAHPALRSWTLAVAVHGGIAGLLLAGALAPPRSQPEQFPVFEIVIPPAQSATQPPVPQPASAEASPPEPVADMLEPVSEPQIMAPAPKPVMPPRPRPPRQSVQPMSETPPSAQSATATVDMPPAPVQPVAAPALPQPPAIAEQAAPHYAPILLDWLGRHRDYPRAARLRRQEGIPRIALTLDRSGRLLDLELKEASGHDLLDQAALDMARRAAPFPPPQLPPGSEKATFIVPVRFHLERR